MKLLFLCLFFVFSCVFADRTVCNCNAAVLTLHKNLNMTIAAADGLFTAVHGSPCMTKDVIYNMRYVFYSLLRILHFVQGTPLPSDIPVQKPYPTDCGVLQKTVDNYDNTLPKTENSNVKVHVCSCKLDFDLQPETDYVDNYLRQLINGYN
ncbi:hypothetical protein QR680_015725 [Steinernema hermaphroditum]|uniref:Uncharacterized protein n=1 Tax=Steinernema hermaphroditum TaxID=289476 RepID=A0AA39H909_9BILA|nr:hypothetical protein QR680_015725 [Steinernema hermaphroditum]